MSISFVFWLKYTNFNLQLKHVQLFFVNGILLYPWISSYFFFWSCAGSQEVLTLLKSHQRRIVEVIWHTTKKDPTKVWIQSWPASLPWHRLGAKPVTRTLSWRTLKQDQTRFICGSPLQRLKDCFNSRTCSALQGAQACTILDPADCTV